VISSSRSSMGDDAEYECSLSGSWAANHGHHLLGTVSRRHRSGCVSRLLRARRSRYGQRCRPGDLDTELRPAGRASQLVSATATWQPAHPRHGLGTPARAPLPDAQRTAGRRRSGASGLAELPLDPGTQRVLTMGTPCFGTHEDSYFVPAKCSTAVARRPTGYRSAASGRPSWAHEPLAVPARGVPARGRS
jgi:hypothetical protein